MENEIYDGGYTRQLGGQKSAALTILFVALLTDIFFVPGSSDFIIFGILGFYGIGILVYKLSSNTTFLICLALLIVTYIQFLFLGSSATTEKSAVWFILLFIVGVVQRFRE